MRDETDNAPLADLTPGTRPVLQVAVVDDDPTLSDLQKRALKALATLLNASGTAEDIAHRLGYRPARTGRLAVASAMRALLDPTTNLGAVGFYVTRTAPRDRWGSQHWHLNHTLISHRDLQGRRCTQTWRGQERVWVVLPERIVPAQPLPKGRLRAEHRALL